MSRVLAVAALAGVYLLAIASIDPLDVAAAIAIAGALAAVVYRDRIGGSGAGAAQILRRVAGFPGFALAVLYEIVVGTWQVALIVLGVRDISRAGIVAVPIGERTPTGVAVSALAITLSPGELLVDVDEERGVMLIHVLDASNPDALRRRYEDFYRRRQRAVFP